MSKCKHGALRPHVPGLRAQDYLWEQREFIFNMETWKGCPLPTGLIMHLNRVLTKVHKALEEQGGAGSNNTIAAQAVLQPVWQAKRTFVSHLMHDILQVHMLALNLHAPCTAHLSKSQDSTKRLRLGRSPSRGYTSREGLVQAKGEHT